MHDVTEMSYLDFVFAVRDAIFAKREQGRALSDAEKTVSHVWPFVAEVENGSLDQFLLNDSGNAYPETIDALKQIGCKRAAGALETFATRLFGRNVPRDRMERMIHLDSLPSSVRFGPPVDTLNQQVFEDDLRVAELAFILDNQESLPVPDGPRWTLVADRRALRREQE